MSSNSWMPFKEIAEMWNKYNRLFESNPYSETAQSPVATVYSPEALSKWTPSTDILELDYAYLFKVELPAVRFEDIQLNVVNKQLRIEGERKDDGKDIPIDVLRAECFHGRFARSFALPADADEDQITAELKDGLLSVWVNKLELNEKTAVTITNLN